MSISARDQMVAYFMVGRNLQEIADFGRILTDGERKEVKRLEGVAGEEYSKGMDAATNGAKMKTNPHPGGSLEWWSWHEGYKASKKIEADLQRQKARGK
jgi:hypothetical protein